MTKEEILYFNDWIKYFGAVCSRILRHQGVIMSALSDLTEDAQEKANMEYIGTLWIAEALETEKYFNDSHPRSAETTYQGEVQS